MSRYRWLNAIALAIAISGCGEGDVAKPAAKAPAASLANTSAKSGEQTKKEEPAKSDVAKSKPRRAMRKEHVAQLFSVPEVVRPADEGRGGDGQSDRPRIRLLGFSRIDGDANALVEIKGEVLAIKQGDMIEGAEVVTLESDMATFQFAGQRWSTRLFDQPWLNEQKAFSNIAVVHTPASEVVATAARNAASGPNYPAAATAAKDKPNKTLPAKAGTMNLEATPAPSPKKSAGN